MTMSQQEKAYSEYKRMIGILKENNEDWSGYNKILFGYIDKQINAAGSSYDKNDYWSIMLAGIPKAFVAFCSLMEYEQAIKDLKERRAAILRGEL